MKIVVLDKASIGEDTPLEVLNKFGEVVVFQSSTPTEAAERSVNADVIVINKIKVTRDYIEASKRLKLVCVFATGYDNIDIAAAKENNVAVCNVPGYSTDSVTLFTVSTALALYSHLYEYNRFVRSGEYSISDAPNRLIPVYHDLKGKVWGIIGYGNIGRSVGLVATALGARVIVYKRNPCSDAECVDIETLCRESDIISVHCPLNDDSRRLINSDKIALMKPGVILVNEARGAVLDEEAVTVAVEDRKIGGFGCDVYSIEPFGLDHPYDRIKDRDNVLLTPHAAWGSYESRERCINIIAHNIQSFLNGERLNRVDK